MKTRERILIYGAMMLLVAMNIAVLSGGRGQSAWALNPADQERLGPAAALTLVDDEDSKLDLRNAGGRLAWDDTEYARAYSVAFVHVGKALGPLMEADEYVEEYGRLEAEIREKDEEFSEAIVAFTEEHKDMTPDDPGLGQAQQTFQAMLQQREQWRVSGSRQLGLLAAGQIERAYRDLIAAVEVVAERRRIDLVFRFIPTGNEFQAISPPQAYTGIHARIALRYPEGLDVTDEVMEELALEVE